MLKRLSGIFRPPPIGTPDGLRAQIVSDSSRIAQKATTGYCRIKAGTNVDLLFREIVFLDALEESRWTAFGLVLADLCLVAEGFLRPHAAGREDDLARWIVEVYDSVLAVHPHRTGPAGWDTAQAEFRIRLTRARLAAPVPAAHIGGGTAQRVYDGLPVHPRLRREDFELVENLMRFGHVGFREELERRVDACALLSHLPVPSDE